MLKVYLKGFDRPYAVFGHKVFEDERFFVIGSDNIQSRIPWGNILYVESIMLDEKIPAQDAIPSVGPPDSLLLEQKLAEAMRSRSAPQSITVIFTGFKEKSFVVSIPSDIPMDKYSAKLANAIFADIRIKAFLGDFSIAGIPHLEGKNVIIPTAPIANDMSEQRQPAIDQSNEVGKKNQIDAIVLKEKVDAATKMLSSLAGPMSNAGKTGKTSLGLDAGFSMPGSPFGTTISLQDEIE